MKQYQVFFDRWRISKQVFADEALRRGGAQGDRAQDRLAACAILETILLETMFDLPALDGVGSRDPPREVVEGTARPLYIYADRSDRAVESSAMAC